MREPEFYKLVTTVTRNDDSKNIYNVPVRKCNQQTSVEESKYEEKRNNALIFLLNISQRRNKARYQKRKQYAYSLFVVRLPYSINKAIRIHVFYRPWHQHCIIWVMNMRQNISSGISKNLFWQFRIKFRCTSAVIFLWGIWHLFWTSKGHFCLRLMIYYGAYLSPISCNADSKGW